RRRGNQVRDKLSCVKESAVSRGRKKGVGTDRKRTGANPRSRSRGRRHRPRKRIVKTRPHMTPRTHSTELTRVVDLGDSLIKAFSAWGSADKTVPISGLSLVCGLWDWTLERETAAPSAFS